MNLEKYLIPEWRESWRFASVQATAAVGAIGAAVASYPDLILQLSILLGGSTGIQAVVIGASILIIALRVWRQGDDAQED